MKKKTKENLDKSWWDKLFRRKKTMTKEDAKSVLSAVRKIRKENGFRIKH